LGGEAEAPYYAIYGDYRGSRPRFYPREECPWLGRVEEAWKEIRAEFEDYHYRWGRPLEENFDPYDLGLSGWKTLNFVTYLRRYHRSCRAFPRTVALLESIPGLTSAFLNKLEPHSHVSPHNGDSNTTYRCHLGLIVPGGVEECGLQIGEERRGWQEGEAFAFCDAHRHWVWNDTDRDRVVLVFDVVRPEYAHRRLAICGKVLAAIALTLVRTRVPPLRRLPRPLLRAVHELLGLGFRLWLPLQRRWSR
jgi:aspartyl/asparaginyl beta-hydroxylase (cupin superfamily)